MRFSKMHGLGNDVVIVDARDAPLTLPVEQIQAMGERHTGVGFDQLISIEPPRTPGSAFYYGIWNTDGTPAGQCGNGVRCVAAWLHRAGCLALNTEVLLQSPSGLVTVRLLDAQRVAVAMGEPDFQPAHVPFDTPARAQRYPLAVDASEVTIGAVSLGNPHAVVVVPSLDAPGLARLGPAITGHPRFAEGANAGFVQIASRRQFKLRVHERGAGWTQACGSGACAAMAVLRERGEVDACVQVDLPGGRLQIDWPGPGQPLWMTGPAAFVYEGEWL